MSAVNAGETQVFPAFPTFHCAPVPTEIFLTKRTGGLPTRNRVIPTKAYRGFIQSFDTDRDAALVARDLAAGRPVDVHGGYVLPDAHSSVLPAFSEERKLTGMHEQFEVLVLAFDHTPDPWVCITDPPYSRSLFPNHPHPRGDREMMWNGQRLHALCVYSAAEFSLVGQQHPMSAYLAQVSIFLANHLIWLRTGIWLGKVARTGDAHLQLDLGGPCWCGDGRKYRDCCFRWEIVHFLRKVKGLTVPADFEFGYK